MEKIYLGQDDENNVPRRIWHSDKIKLREYFESFSKEVSKCVQHGNFNLNSVLKSVLPDSISLNKESFDTLEKLTCIDQLKPKGKFPKLIKIKQPMKEETLPSSGRDKTIMGFGLNEKGNKKGGRSNPTAGWDYFVSFCVYKPFRREDSSPSHFSQEIRVLGSQTLEVLRDKIICESDFQDVQGDLSYRPITPISLMTRDIYRSAMFYIDNTFYIDRRHADNVDYSDVIRKWALGRGIFVGPTLDMREITTSKLALRFGYPYLYLHQGCCEHLIIVNDARLLNQKDSLSTMDYPLMSSFHRSKTIFCVICLTRNAKWIVTGNDRLLYDVSHMCEACFHQFNYKDGKKHGYFKAYRFVDAASLL